MLVVVLMPRSSKQLKLGRVDPSKRDEEQKSLKLTTQAQNLTLKYAQEAQVEKPH